MYLANLYSSSNRVAINSVLHILKKYNYANKLKFNKNPSILEIGTGDGNVTVHGMLPILPAVYKELILSDKSPQMLEHAKKVPELARMQFVLLDIETENIPVDFKERFDNVFSFLTFHFVKNTRQCLQNIYDMLKPGGETFCIFLRYTPLDFSWTALGKHPKWSKYDPNPWVSPYYRNPKVLEIYLQHLEGCGFKTTSIHSDEYLYHFSSAKEYKDLLKSVNLSVNKIPEEHLEEYLEYYYNLIRDDELWSFKTKENGVEETAFIMKLATFHACKPS